MSTHVRYCIVNSVIVTVWAYAKNEFSMYEKSSRDNCTKVINLEDILDIQKDVFPSRFSHF